MARDNKLRTVITHWRWDEGVRFIDQAVDTYGKVYHNLKKHAEGYPEPSVLKERIYDGDHLTGKWWQYLEAGSYPKKVNFIEEDNKNIGVFNFNKEKSADENRQAIEFPFHVPSPGRPIAEDLIASEIEIVNHVRIPFDVQERDTLHFIAEVKDSGHPSLRSYKRLVLQVVRD